MIVQGVANNYDGRQSAAKSFAGIIRKSFAAVFAHWLHAVFYFHQQKGCKCALSFCATVHTV